MENEELTLTITLGDSVEEVNEEIEPGKPLNQVQQQPYEIADTLVWDSLDINSPTNMDELYLLLSNNYVEDSHSMFRFDYSREFLHWALTPPGWRKDWHLAIRNKSDGELLCFISAIPANLRSLNKAIPLVEINYLCIHKTLRDKRMAPVLIQEITRRVHLTNRWQAVYTAGKLLPRPVSIARYFHRSLNPKKLVDVEFSAPPQGRATMAMMMKLYRVNPEPQVPGIRPMTSKDCAQVHKLLSDYLAKFKLAPLFTVEEVRHFLLPIAGVVNSYVVENAETKQITDFISFYTLPSTIVNHSKYKILKAAYSFYNVSTVTPLEDLMNDALTFAKQEDFDVFNALDLMDNNSFLESLKFKIGDGKLRYYLYNWNCPTLTPQDVGLVLM